MKSANILFFNVIILFSLVSEARFWNRVDIPGATCGDGSQYSVFVDTRNKSTEKLLIEFMGGGACWSAKSCYGLGLKAWIRKIPQIPAFSYLTYENSSQPWNNHSTVYFPYCTGDVFAGDTQIRYETRGLLVHHTGYSNVVKALKHLSDYNYINFSSYNDVTVWGASAGGIASLLHARNIQPYLNPAAKRTLISDSPGLHFGKTFWNKFSLEMQEDFRKHFAAVGLVYPSDDGFISKYMGPVLEGLSRWNVGIMQASRDYFMSEIYGNISPRDHEYNVFSSDGIGMIARPYKHVATWTPRTYMHTFLLIKPSSQIEDDYSQSGMDFAKQLYAQPKTDAQLEFEKGL